MHFRAVLSFRGIYSDRLCKWPVRPVLQNSARASAHGKEQPLARKRAGTAWQGDTLLRKPDGPWQSELRMSQQQGALATVSCVVLRAAWARDWAEWLSTSTWHSLDCVQCSGCNLSLQCKRDWPFNSEQVQWKAIGFIRDRNICPGIF